jgi:serine/threonine protein phosphatase 1
LLAVFLRSVPDQICSLGHILRRTNFGITIVFKRLNSRTKRPKVPDGLRFYVVGDVHGRADLLDQVLERIDEHLAVKPAFRPVEIFLGDYIDRGPGSREVLDRLIARSRACETVCLKGNHETYVEGFLSNPTTLSEWRYFGGLQTLLSYGLAPAVNMTMAEQAELAATFGHALPESHRRFLTGLISSFTCGDYFFVHAGVRPGIPLPKQCEADLLWIREDFLLCEENFSKIIVHGHSPVPEPDIRPYRINIDTGAYATGQLTCLILEGDDRHFI